MLFAPSFGKASRASCCIHHTTVVRCAPLAVLIPEFPSHRELLKEIGPELKHIFLEVSSGNRTLSDASQMSKGTTHLDSPFHGLAARPMMQAPVLAPLHTSKRTC